MKALEPNVEELKLMVKSFVDELQLGLRCHRASQFDQQNEECSFKMLDSYVPRPPNGSETGIYYALDFGGTNFRVVRASLEDGLLKSSQKHVSLSDCTTTKDLPKGLLDPMATASMMFDFFAESTKEFMQENGDLQRKQKVVPVGFTFSYPCSSKRVDSATLMVWTKGYETGRDTDDPVEGLDVAELMNHGFARKGVPLKVNCVANDTVGTLLSCGYSLAKEKAPCCVGVILGTGMNACYLEPQAKEFGYVGNIINIECGNFNRDTLPRINIDNELDFDDVGGRGRQHLEKMVSGAYLGEIVRRSLVKVFQYKTPPMMWNPGTLTAEDAAVIVGDKSAQLVVVGRKCFERWNATFDAKELHIVKDLCTAVYSRAAALSAMLIAGCCIRTGKLQRAMDGVTVGIDGSLFKHNQFFRENIREYLVHILGPKQASLVHLTCADDGSGLGAAILSAIVDS